MSKSVISKKSAKKTDDTLIIYVHSKVMTEARIEISQNMTDEEIESLVDELVEKTLNICDESYITKIYDKKFKVNYKRISTEDSEFLYSDSVSNKIVKLNDEDYEIQCV